MASVNKLRPEVVASLSPRDLLNRVLQSGEKIGRQEMVPVHRIATQGAIFDTTHARELGKVMQGDFGITQSALLRPRFKNENRKEIVYDWMDGLHRIKGIELEFPDGINAEMKSFVLYGCSDTEMYRQRILAADNVKSIRFARICMFINDAWHITPWHDKITATQAFYLAVQIGSGKQIVKDEAMVEDIKRWALESAKGWNLRVGTIYQDLLTFDLSDPELVVRVRSGSSFQKGEMAVTPNQLSMIAELLPHKDYPGIQMLIANYVNSGVSTEKLGLMLQEIRQLKHINQETVLPVLRDGEWKQKETQTSSKPHKIETPRTAETITEEPTLKNAVGHLEAAQNIVVFSYDLSAPQKERIANQIGTVISQLEPKNATPIKIKASQKKPESPITIRKTNRSSIEFMEKWMNESQLEKLSSDQTAIKEFAKEVAELSDPGIYNIAKLFFAYLISGDPAKRSIATNVFDCIPFNILQQSYINDLFKELAKQVKEDLTDHLYKHEQIDEILNLLLSLIDQKFVTNKISMSQEAENLLFDAINSSASYIQTQSREEIEAWVKNHHYLLLEENES